MTSITKQILKVALILLIGISCKKETIEPLIVDAPKEISKYIYPTKIEIFDSINNCSATVYVEYTFDKKVKKIRREVTTLNSVLDSTFEINYTYEGQNLIKMTRAVAFLPSSKPDRYTEMNYQYKEGRIYTAQRITTNDSQDLDTANYNYFVIKKSDGLDYLSYVKGIDSISVSQYVSFIPQMDGDNFRTFARTDCGNCEYTMEDLDMWKVNNSPYEFNLIFRVNGGIYNHSESEYYDFMLRSNQMLKIQNSVFENIEFIANVEYKTHRIYDLVYFQEFFRSLPLSIDLKYVINNDGNSKTLDYETKIELNSNSNGELIDAELEKNLLEQPIYIGEIPKLLVERRSYKFYY